MKIYTKGGDTGETSLIGGSRVKKNDVRIEAYGTVDELNAFIGLIRDAAVDQTEEAHLIQIQHELFIIGSTLAAEKEGQTNLPVLDPSSIERLEKTIDALNEKLPALRNFILPGGDRAASYCHIARTVCRRAERRTVALAELSKVENALIRYLNRLSDYLFTLARHYTQAHNGEETLWKTKG